MTRGGSRPQASVVIPVRNGAAVIEGQLAALAAQDFPEPFGVVVADNGSTDATAAVVAAWCTRLPGLKVANVSSRLGASSARNAGAAQARSRLLLYCDADDEVSPSWVSAMVRALARADLATGPAEQFDDTGRELGLLAAHQPPSAFGFRPYGIGANLGVRREAFDRVGGFDERWPVHGGEDVDFCWRAQLAGAELGFSRDVRVRYRRPSQYGSIFRKRLGYGIGSRVLARRYRPFGLRDRPGRRLARTGVGLGLRLPWLFTAEGRRDWCGRAGTIVGMIRGSVWSGRYAVDPVGPDGLVRPAAEQARRTRP